eukprot:5372638-Pyramimonas_sp.AAC.1
MLAPVKVCVSRLAPASGPICVNFAAPWMNFSLADVDCGKASSLKSWDQTLRSLCIKSHLLVLPFSSSLSPSSSSTSWGGGARGDGGGP